jgi:hypothetical protein
MFQTIIEITAHERSSKKKDLQKDYHFTIVDIKSPVIARDLVVLMLLDELSELTHDAARAKSSKVLMCLFYTYLSAIMPSSLYEVLQETIGKAKNALENNTLPPFVEIPDMYRAEIVCYLDDWQRKVQQEYPITRLQPEVVRTREQHPEFVDLPPNGKAAQETAFEEQTGALILPAPYNNLLDPSLREAFDAFGSRGSPAAVRKAVQAIHNTWSTNPTLVDLAWERSRDPTMEFDVGNSAAHFTEKIGKKMMESGFRLRGPMSQMSLFEFPAQWFISLAQGLKQLLGRIRIEACVGDVTAVLEQIKHGAVGHRKPRATPGYPGPTARRRISTSLRPHPSQQRPRLHWRHSDILLVRVTNDPSRPYVLHHVDMPTKPSAFQQHCGVRCRVRRSVQRERSRNHIRRQDEAQLRPGHANVYIQPMAPPRNLARVQESDAASKAAGMALPSLLQNRIAARETHTRRPAHLLPAQPHLLLPPMHAPPCHRLPRPLVERGHIQPPLRHRNHQCPPTALRASKSTRDRCHAQTHDPIRRAFQSRTLHPRRNVAAPPPLQHPLPRHRPSGNPPKIQHDLRPSLPTESQLPGLRPRLPQRRSALVDGHAEPPQRLAQRRARQRRIRQQDLPRRARQYCLDLDVAAGFADCYVLAQGG